MRTSDRGKNSNKLKKAVVNSTRQTYEILLKLEKLLGSIDRLNKKYSTKEKGKQGAAIRYVFYQNNWHQRKASRMQLYAMYSTKKTNVNM